MKKAKLLLGVIVFSFSNLFAQTDSVKTDIYDLSLEKLMNMEVTVASKKALTLRESPGIITVVTEEEIKNSGARDLVDILRLVPGIFFGVDVQGVVGIGSRGSWGHEGKILLQIDGQEQNELAYSTLQFGNHFNIDQIKRIEIIRGPGSSIYGGFAELGVINIITKTAEEINGIGVKGSYGQMEKSYARRNVNVSFGKKINDFEISLLGLIGEGNRSDQTFTDIYGDSYDMSKGGGFTNPTNLNLGMNYKNLKTRFIYDNYTANTVSVFDAIHPYAYDLKFESMFAEIKYDFNIKDKLTITPKINYKRQLPWQVFDTTAYPLQVLCERFSGNLTASYDINEKINILAGGEYLYDIATDQIGDSTFFNGTPEVKFNNVSAFAQALFKTKFVNLTLGVRIDKHSEVTIAYSPRIGLTKVVKDFHFKLLYSQAFRAPGVENMNFAYKLENDVFEYIAPNILPEKTNVIEFEVGYKLADKMFLTVNLFNVFIKDPIVFFYDVVSEAEGYYNATQTGTRGIEFEYKIRDKWGYITTNYSFYTAKDINEVVDYQIPNPNPNVKVNALLAAPQHKVTLNSSFKIDNNLSVNPSFIFMSKRYCYVSLDTTETEVLSEQKPILLANLFINYNNLFTKGLTLGVGIYDILDTKFSYIQPYNGWHSPYPGTSREIILKIAYKFNFEK
jgi:outer membrane receptor for ferrienterochelin and colicin